MPSFEVKHDSRLSRGISRARAYAAARPKRHFVGAFAVLLGVVILLLPSPYVIEMPGPTQDVLGKVEDGAVIDITGTGVTTYKDSGKLLLTTVNASGVPGYPIINAQAVWGWSNPQVEVMPREATVPVGQSADQYQKKVEQDMAGSQDSASAVGLAYAKAHADELGIDASALQHAKVTMHVDSIGGPARGRPHPNNSTRGPGTMWRHRAWSQASSALCRRFCRLCRPCLWCRCRRWSCRRSRWRG